MGAGRVLCGDVLCRCMRTCVFQFHPRSVGLSVDPSTTSRHFGAETKKDIGFITASAGIINYRKMV